MSNLKSTLTANENIIYQAKLNWSEYLKGVGILLLGIVLSSFSNGLGGFIILIGILYLPLTFLEIRKSEFVVTDKRILIKTGLIDTKSFDVLLNKIESIAVKQEVLNKLVNSGTVSIKGTGGSNSRFHNIDDPMVFRRIINEQIEKLK